MRTKKSLIVSFPGPVAPLYTVNGETDSKVPGLLVVPNYLTAFAVLHESSRRVLGLFNDRRGAWAFVAALGREPFDWSLPDDLVCPAQRAAADRLARAMVPDLRV